MSAKNKPTIASLLGNKESRDRILAEVKAKQASDGLLYLIPSYDWNARKPLPKKKK